MTDRKRILIVDDEIAVGNILAACCDLWGMEPVVATTGAEALQMIEERVPDLIMTDFMMPGMTGHEVCRRARTDDRLKSVPIILMSSAPEAAGRNSPADALVAKPFDLDQVEGVIRHWIRQRT